MNPILADLLKTIGIALGTELIRGRRRRKARKRRSLVTKRRRRGRHW